MALTADRDTLQKYDPAGIRRELLATDSTQYFKGGVVALVAGRLVKPTTATVGASAVFMCEENVLTGVSTTELVKCRSGVFKLVNGDTIVSPGDLGKLAYVGANGDDGAYKAGAAATDVVLGTIEGVDGAGDLGGAGVWVNLRGFHEIVGATAGTNVSGS